MDNPQMLDLEFKLGSPPTQVHILGGHGIDR